MKNFKTLLLISTFLVSYSVVNGQVIEFDDPVNDVKICVGAHEILDGSGFLTPGCNSVSGGLPITFHDVGEARINFDLHERIDGRLTAIGSGTLQSDRTSLNFSLEHHLDNCTDEQVSFSTVIIICIDNDHGIVKLEIEGDPEIVFEVGNNNQTCYAVPVRLCCFIIDNDGSSDEFGDAGFVSNEGNLLSLDQSDKFSFDKTSENIVEDLYAGSSKENSILIYPNPTNSLIFIEGQVQNISILNTLQEEVYRLDQNDLSTKLSIDVSTLNAGLYFLISEKNGIKEVNSFYKI